MEAQPLLTAYAKYTVAKRFQSPMAEILHEVQVHHVFPDSKEFVDMPMKHDPQVICESWRKLMSREDTTALNKEVLHRFVEEHFAPPGSDTVQCTTFSDYTHNPAFLSNITDSAFRDWAQTLNDLWPIFGRRTADDVSIHPERYTLFPQRNPFLVPGGRFREFYYWDSFWIIKGLLLSEMVQTARGIIENMVDMVDRFGFVPNGSRSYYLNRSQPPLLCEMVHAYYHTTKDSEFVRQVVGTLEKEYAFWMSTNDKTGGHAVEIKGKDNAIYTLNRYTVKVTEPRPESYREDLQLAIDLGLSPEQAPEIYGEIAAACESGWDFTSRWFKDQHHLNTIHIRDLLPVDLNSILYKYETNLAEFFADVMKDDERASVYRQKADTRKAAMRLFLWDAEEGQWFDYDIKENAKKLIVSVSNFFPLWAGAYDPDQVQSSVKAILNSQLVQHGGLVGTCLYTHQQWDFPNGWPPLQWFLVEALRNANTEESKALAEDVAVKWLYNNYAGFELSGGKMYEKYDVRVWGFRGFGGEYEPQDGFGWSNGVCLCLLDLYGKSMTYEAFKQMRPLDEKGSMQEIKSMFTITKGDMRYIVRMMNKDMNRGLKKDGVSAMRMAPTFVTRCPRGGEEGVGYAMHLGKGLDLRLFRVEKQAAENGLGKTTQKVVPIPPELIRGKGTELFDFMANQLKAFIIESADTERTSPIPLNFIFGFPIEQTALDKARLVKWVKGFSASGVEGEDVMELLRDALRRADMQSTVKVVGLVNDSVGTLVAGLASETNCIIGTIVGTGTNLSYYEQVKRIKKLKHFYEACPLSCPKEMIVNMEWARFGDGSDVLPVNMFDKMLDANSSNPGEHTLEKMTSGMYLGELARCVIMHLMEKKVIRKIKGFERRGAITVDHLARMMDDNSTDLDDVERFLKESFQFISLPNERKDMRKVATWVTLRACRLIASGIGAVAYRRGVVEDATVSTDGSVLERTQQVFFRTVQAALKEIFATNIHVNMVFNKDSAGRGAAMIALLES